MKKSSKNDPNKLSERKKIPKQIKDQLNPLVQKLMNICSSVKLVTRQAEWDEIKRIFELLKSIQDLEAKFQTPLSDRSSHLKKFYDWCSDNSAVFASITLKEIKDGNFGVFAEQDIKEGEHFLTVPRKIMMSETSAKNSKLGSLISSDPILQNMPNVAVAMHLLMESLDPKSFWMPYISILPNTYNTILYFSFEEIKELHGSPVLDEVFKILRSVVRQYCYFFQLFQRDSTAISLNIGQYFTYELYRWAVSSVMTRQNVIPSADGQFQIISLIPLFDMCNHANGKSITEHPSNTEGYSLSLEFDSYFNKMLLRKRGLDFAVCRKLQIDKHRRDPTFITLSTDFNLEKDSLISYSYKSCPQGQEVLMFYGPRTNSDFLVHNGFVYPENENDSLEIKLGISKNDPLYSLKSNLCAKVGIPINGPFYIYKEKDVPKKLLIFLEITVMKSGELENILNTDDGTIDMSFSENTDLLKRAYLFLKDRIFLLLKSYKRTLEEDEEFLKQNVPESEHQHLVVLLHLCEKKILSRVYELCEKKTEKY